MNLLRKEYKESPGRGGHGNLRDQVQSEWRGRVLKEMIGTR